MRIVLRPMEDDKTVVTLSTSMLPLAPMPELICMVDLGVGGLGNNHGKQLHLPLVQPDRS